jgi:hypothetical protein
MGNRRVKTQLGRCVCSCFCVFVCVNSIFIQVCLKSRMDLSVHLSPSDQI